MVSKLAQLGSVLLAWGFSADPALAHEGCGLHEPVPSSPSPSPSTSTSTLTPMAPRLGTEAVALEEDGVLSGSGGGGILRVEAMSVDSFAVPLATVTITGVGGNGTYNKVTAMDCPSDNTCQRTPVAVSGALAPFDEELTLALRGPLRVDAITVFTSPDGSAWSRASAFTRSSPPTTPTNMVFLNNHGDPQLSGVSDTCNGHSQSFASADGTAAAASPTVFGGDLGAGISINVLSATSCGAANSSGCGFTRGVAMTGWRGPYKIFMVQATMPSAPSGAPDTPAIELLNAQIVHTAQFGCNCRGGTGGGGCGALEVAEVPADAPDWLTTSIASFQGHGSSGPYTLRPTDDPVVFVAVLSAGATPPTALALGQAQVLLFRPEDVDLGTPPSAAQVREWLAFRNGPEIALAS